jgi:hypothetical protein
MTPITRLLKQRPLLCEHAVERTRDVNEGYLLVHNVMARALGRANDAEHDLGAALTYALDLRAKHLL